jgi:hypothetical protein
MYVIRDREYRHRRPSGTVAGYHFKHVWHQVRNPLMTINSVSTHNYRMMRWIFKQLGVTPRNRLHGQMLYWLRWNRRCQEAASWTFRLEDLRPRTPTWERVKAELGLPSLMHDFGFNTNTRHGRSSYTHYGWHDLDECDSTVAEEIRLLATEYGYSTA